MFIFMKYPTLKFFYINLGLVVLFAFLYYIQDVFITNNMGLARKLYLIDDTKDGKDYKDEPGTLFYYLWFSLMTQTTVGYNGFESSRTGKQMPFMKEPNRLAKIINMIQLISILFIISVL